MSLRRDFIKLSLGAGVAGALALSALPTFAQGAAAAKGPVTLLLTGKYPPQLFAVIIGGNRWIFRVIAYASLMTDQYPPFRLDQGGSQPTAPPPVVPTAGPADPRVSAPVVTTP